MGNDNQAQHNASNSPNSFSCINEALAVRLSTFRRSNLRTRRVIAWTAASLLTVSAGGCQPSSPQAGNGNGEASPASATTTGSGRDSESAAQARREAEAEAARTAAREAAVRARRDQIAAAQTAAAAGDWETLEKALEKLQSPSPSALPSGPAGNGAKAGGAANTTDGSRSGGAGSGGTGGEPGVDLDPPLSSEEIAAIADLGKQLEAGRAKAADAARSAKLAQARQWVDSGRLDDAQAAIRDVVTRAPSDEQRDTAQQLTEEIERIRKARRQLKSWLTMLASTEAREVQTAQTQLLQDPDTATGMILESLRTTEKPEVAVNYLETLRQIGRSEIVVPALLDVLRDEQRKGLWPVITRDLPQLAGPSAGPALLELAAKSTDEAQRLAALEALASAAEPPVEAFVTLEPLLAVAGPTRLAALRAITRTVALHGQRDLWAERGLDGAIQPAAVERLRDLPDRLQAWIKPPSGTDSIPPELAREARRLAAVLGRDSGGPLPGVKVVRAEAETADGPATAALDGVWNSLDLKTMWRFPAGQRGSILLDLGEERLVTGVRIWNWNETSGTQRGWKDVELYVSNTPAELNPTATGIVLPAPGVADPPDYGAVIPVPAVVGRYVRIQAKSFWTVESHSGLAEVQVIGF